MSKPKRIMSVFLLFINLLLAGCSPIGNKTASMTIVYIATTFFAFLLLMGYCFVIKKRETWFYVLFSSVLVVNIGYLLLATAKTLDGALWANRIAYLGSVFLPLSMLKSIQKISKLKYSKWLNIALIVISAFVFLVAASPGWLDIYYKSVTLENIDGVAVLNKEYGPWHSIYLFYLVGYFITMIATSIHAIKAKKIESTSNAVIVLIAVFVNICVWLTEQLVKFDFEFLSISYIITEIFLLGVYLIIQTHEEIINALKAQNLSAETQEISDLTQDFIEHCTFISEQLTTLTAKEKELYDCYISGKSTKEILDIMNIKENTLKFHSKNLYSKLGVTSRKQLTEYVKAMQKAKA